LKRIKRIYVQITSAVFFNLPFLATYLKYAPVPVFNCYACPLAAGACPIGTLQFFFTTGQFPVFAVGALFLMGILLGRFFCGYLCPFGLFQDLLFRTNKKEIPVPGWFGYLKYAVLVILVIVLPLILLTPVFCKLCPAGTLESGLPLIGGEYIKKWSDTLPFGFSALLGMIGILFLIKGIILVITVSASLFMKRPFCRVCPLGAIFSFFNKFHIFHNLKIEKNVCVDCKACQKACPAGIDPMTELNNKDCIQCDECVDPSCHSIESRWVGN
jgi:polyferredoxin